MALPSTGTGDLARFRQVAASGGAKHAPLPAALPGAFVFIGLLGVAGPGVAGHQA
jgi:hypothetical protein